MKANEIMKISPIVPVIALDKAEDALPLAEALLAGGVAIMEITLRTASALDCIEIIAKQFPQMNVGAGTVTNASNFQDAINAGAQFAFSPGISQEIMDFSRTSNVTLIPGVCTASEVMFAQNNDFLHCKLFPATVAGGTEALKAFAGPFSQMRFCPTGGVSLENIKSFLSLPNVLCAGGSWIVPKRAIEDKNFQLITKLCKEVFEVIS
jgi:2-dehydro-3-deoxyphosphogluconate aldolase/(4S)-4-hydroxy-2-oxoglutarate aldolase